MANDWDFSDEGRRRQSLRMKALADFEKENGRTVICDFICPTREAREIFNADYCIWMDTIKESNYKDTDKIFEEPDSVNLKISKWNEYNPKQIAKLIKIPLQPIVGRKYCTGKLDESIPIAPTINIHEFDLC